MYDKLKSFFYWLGFSFVTLVVFAIMVLFAGCTSNPKVKEEEPISVREVNIVDALIRLNAEMDKLVIAVDELNVSK